METGDSSSITGLTTLQSTSVFLPRIDETLDSLNTATFSYIMDIHSGNWKIEVDETNREKTAFITPYELYEYKVMPFEFVTHRPLSRFCLRM